MVPALYNLSRTKLLPEKFALIGVDRVDGTAESWRDGLLDMLKSIVKDPGSGFKDEQIDMAAWERLAGAMSYIRGDLTGPEVYGKVRDALAEADAKCGTEGNAVFYLAVVSQLFEPVVEQLGKAELTKENSAVGRNQQGWRRVVIEKPFGHSLDSARELNKRILRILGEDQIFRIDHFLGKDTVQSIMAFRFANGLFEPIWNRDRIDHVQITAAETVGVERRGRFYEAT
ncbi:glucose-6-phosphate dehydrogenase, partial [Rhizobiaceae sp. 2RAB30]